MAGLVVTTKAELRPCIADGRKALFHRWCDRCEVVAPSLMKGGHSGGEVRWVAAIVEYEDGTCGTVQPSDIRFLDNQHENYYFGEREQ